MEFSIKHFHPPMFSYRRAFWVISIAFYCFVVGAVIPLLSPFIAAFLVLPVFAPLLLGNLFSFEFPINTLRKLLISYFAVMVIWPGYLAVQLPGPDLNPQRLILGLLALITICSLFSWRVRAWVVNELNQAKWWVFGLLLLFVHRFISAVLGVGPVFSIGIVFRELIEIYFVAVMAYLLFSDFKAARRLFFVLMLCGLVAATMGCVEFVLKKNVFDSISIPGVTMDQDYLLHAISDKTRGDRYRAQAAFFHPLLLAEYCSFAIPLAFYFLVFGEGKLERRLGLLSIVVIPIGAFVTGSRSAFLAVAIMFGLCFFQMFWELRRSRKHAAFGWFALLAASAGILILIPLLMQIGVFDNLIHGKSLAEAQSTNARIRMFSMGMPAIIDSPFFGYGPGLSTTIAGVAQSIDSFYLSYTLESGVIGILVLFGVLFGSVKTAVNTAGLIENYGSKEFVVALLFSMFGSLLIKLILSLNGNSYLIFVSSALLACVPRWYKDARY